MPCCDERGMHRASHTENHFSKVKILSISHTDIKILTQKKVADKYVPNEGTR